MDIIRTIARECASLALCEGAPEHPTERAFHELKERLRREATPAESASFVACYREALGYPSSSEKSKEETVRLIFDWYLRDKMRSEADLPPDGLWNADLPCHEGSSMVGIAETDRQKAEMSHLGNCKDCHQRFTRTPPPEVEALARAVEDHQDCPPWEREHREGCDEKPYPECRDLCAAVTAYRVAFPRAEEGPDLSSYQAWPP